MSKIQRRPALTHPFDDLTQAVPAPERNPVPSLPSVAASTDAAAGMVQVNVRLPAGLRRELRSAAAGMTLATGQRWSQDQIVRTALADYLPRLYAAHNADRPFGASDR